MYLVILEFNESQALLLKLNLPLLAKVVTIQLLTNHSDLGTARNRARELMGFYIEFSPRSVMSF